MKNFFLLSFFSRVAFGSNFDAIINSSPANPANPKSPTAPAQSKSRSLRNTATTTRYWDCSGGSCGCAYLPTHLGGSYAKPAHCHSNAMFAAPSLNPYGAKFYGTAAISQALGGGDWLSEGCGKCWKVTGTSNIPNHDTGTTTTLVLKGANYCPPSNPSCSGDKAHFDIAAPGFDFMGATLSNTCAEREPDENDAFESCGNWMIGSQDPTTNCDCESFSSPTLKAGCKNFKSLYWNNPTVTYEEISCPSELSELPCWEQNGNMYPSVGDEPDLCVEPSSLEPPSPSCFSPFAKVNILGKGRVRMKDLVKGDRVLTANGKYETVFTLNHFHRSKTTTFLRIHTDGLQGEHPIEITSNHLIFTNNEQGYPVPVSDIKVGDSILSAWKGLRKVTRIESITRDGFYSPLTSRGDGTIVVDGIVASIYTSCTGNSHIETTEGKKLISFHKIMDITCAPLRALCSSNGKLNIWSSNWCNSNHEREGERGEDSENESDSGSILHSLRDFFESFFYFWLDRNHFVQYLIFAIYISGSSAVAIFLYWMNTITFATAILLLRCSYRRKEKLM